MAASEAEKSNQPEILDGSVRNTIDQSINARALCELIDMAAVDCGLLIKLVLLAEQPDARSILDALARANMAEIGTVSPNVCALLESVEVQYTEL